MGSERGDGAHRERWKEVDRMKVILLHGNGGSSAKEIWFPYIKRELETLSIEVIARDFPDAYIAREKFWLPFLKNELHADDQSILIGHSSGAVAAMRFAEKNKIFGSVLVGACYTDLGDAVERESGYFNRPWDWESIKKNQNWIIQFASIDDPYIPVEEARVVHKQLDTQYYESTDRGHFGGDINMTEFPELLEALKKKLNI